MNYNKVVLVGRLTRDPEVRYTTKGGAVATFGLACNRRYRDRDGQPAEETTFVDVTAFGDTAEEMRQSLSKGSPVLLEGRLRNEAWVDRNGHKRSFTKVLCESFNLLASRRGDTSPPSQSPSPSSPPKPQTEATSPSQPETRAPKGGEEDDVPF